MKREMQSNVKKVAVLMGGWCSEREVSLSSAKPIIKALEEIGHGVIPIDVTRDINRLVVQLQDKPDVVFNALHGKGGEDGVIQGVLESLKIPYTHSGVMASAIAMDKPLSRKIFEREGISVPRWTTVSLESLQETDPFPYPYVIKPLDEGSSVGVYIVKKPEDKPDLSTWTYGNTILIEEFIDGREIQVGVMGDKAIGAIEIKPLTGFYDYEAKYTEGKAVHLMPAPLSENSYQTVLDIALKAHQAIDCRSVSRADFLYDESKDQFYLLEVNTQPGMTPLSLLPEIAAHQGITFPQLISWIVDHATCER